ncbi:MAG TPA: FAD-dependent oxidoreductase [Burkholderiales bacterium]|nr:FAD-dependent oxidoreductase [Burkholderiales bacterium]
MSDSYDVAVIGEGVSGLTAAQKLAQAGLRAATFEAQLFGGLIVNVNELDPTPAEHGVSGAEYAAGLMQQNAELGVESVQEPVTGIRASGGGFEIVTAGATHKARQVIVASGAKLKRLGVPGEEEYEGRGVSQCADCDGPMYQGERAVVVGGGDSALQEALVLANFCDKVYLVHRRDTYRARADLVEQVRGNSKIAPVLNATVVAVSGDEMVRGVTLRHADGREEKLECAGLFAYIGLAPNADMLPAEVERDAAGAVKTAANFETAVRGLWAIGAVRSGYGGTLPDAITEAGRVADAVKQRLG